MQLHTPPKKKRQKAILCQNAKSPSYSQIPHLIFQGESLTETLQNHFLLLSSLWNSTLFPCRELRCKGIKIQTESLWWLSNQESFLTKPSCKSLASDHDTLEAPRTEQRLKNFILYPNISNKVENPIARKMRLKWQTLIQRVQKCWAKLNYLSSFYSTYDSC